MINVQVPTQNPNNISSEVLSVEELMKWPKSRLQQHCKKLEIKGYNRKDIGIHELIMLIENKRLGKENYQGMTLEVLRELGKKKQIKSYYKLKKSELIEALESLEQ